METKFSASLLMMVAACMLLQVMVIPSSSAYSFLDPVTVHVKNKLSSGRVLYVHCHCTDHELGDQYINIGVEFTFRFRPHFFRKNLWQCYLAPDYNHHAYFHVFDDTTPRRVYDIIFEAREDGVYYINQESEEDEFFSKWLAN
ncbi:S-protein homolog 74 [Linum perenne]